MVAQRLKAPKSCSGWAAALKDAFLGIYKPVPYIRVRLVSTTAEDVTIDFETPSSSDPTFLNFGSSTASC